MKLAILTAMPSELRPVVRSLGLRRTTVAGLTVHEGTLGAHDVVATMTGIGTKLATRVTEQLLAAIPVDHVAIVGIAGGVSTESVIGEVITPELVVDATTGSEHRPAPVGGVTPHGTIRTGDDLILDVGAHAAMRADGIVALDMETASIAAVCERHGTPWSAFRAISDRSVDGLIDEHIMDLTRPDGSANLPAVMRLLARRPWEIRRLARLGRDASTATSAAAAAVVAAFGDGR